MMTGSATYNITKFTIALALQECNQGGTTADNSRQKMGAGKLAPFFRINWAGMGQNCQKRKRPSTKKTLPPLSGIKNKKPW